MKTTASISSDQPASSRSRRMRRGRLTKMCALVAIAITGAAAFSSIGAGSASALPISEWQSECNGFWSYEAGVGYSCLWKGQTGWTRDYYTSGGRYYGTCAGVWGATPRRVCVWI